MTPQLPFTSSVTSWPTVITTLSPAPGTPDGDHVPGVFQFVEPVVLTFVTACAAAGARPSSTRPVTSATRSARARGPERPRSVIDPVVGLPSLISGSLPILSARASRGLALSVRGGVVRGGVVGRRRRQRDDER